jgi:hypothetical protein
METPEEVETPVTETEITVGHTDDGFVALNTGCGWVIMLPDTALWLATSLVRSAGKVKDNREEGHA